MDIFIPSEKRLHREQHGHACPIHARNKCRHASATESCPRCVFIEPNDGCQKTLRGTGLEAHSFPCVSCYSFWRGAYGGESMVDAFVSLEEAAQLAHVVPDARAAAREAREAASDPLVAELVDAARKV
jgi:hypothetical protein